MWYRPNCQPYEPGQHNEVIDDTQDGDEVGNQIQRRQRICKLKAHIDVANKWAQEGSTKHLGAMTTPWHRITWSACFAAEHPSS